MDYNKEIAELKAKQEKLKAEREKLKAQRENLEAQLNITGISEQEKQEKHDINQRIIEITKEITEITREITEKITEEIITKEIITMCFSKLPIAAEETKKVRETKTVQFLDEDGDLVTRDVDKPAFDRWMTDVSCLVPIDSCGNEEPQQVCIFPIVDESRLYRLYHHPVEKAELQHLTDIYEHEFGKACEQLLHDDRALLGDSYKVQVMTDQTKKGKLPLNEFAYRFDATTEVDFYAKNGTAQVVGMFQLIPPSPKKLKKFFDDQEKLRQNFKFQKSYAILGVALGNSKNLSLLSSNFYATFVRSGRGFVKL